jgi:hypothetical protein
MTWRGEIYVFGLIEGATRVEPSHTPQTWARLTRVTVPATVLNPFLSIKVGEQPIASKIAFDSSGVIDVFAALRGEVRIPPRSLLTMLIECSRASRHCAGRFHLETWRGVEAPTP